MKTNTILSGIFFLFAALTINAHPTSTEIKAAEPFIRERLAKELKAFEKGEMTRTQIADRALVLAEADQVSEAEMFLLLKGAFCFYARDQKFGNAVSTFIQLRKQFPELSPYDQNSIKETALRPLSQQNRRTLYNLLENLSAEGISGKNKPPSDDQPQKEKYRSKLEDLFAPVGQ